MMLHAVCPATCQQAILQNGAGTPEKKVLHEALPVNGNQAGK